MRKNKVKTLVCLVILDGFGVSENTNRNAIAVSKMPIWQKMLKKYHHVTLHASGQYVGLLPNNIGNSEVGHLTIGAGRSVDSVLTKFVRMARNGSLSTNNLLIKKLQDLQDSKKNLHLMGLLSDGGVHSHEDSLYGLIGLARQYNINRVYIHAFLDGRDVLPKSAMVYLKRLQKVCDANNAVIASLHGRFYAMDRDNNWDRIQKTYDVLCGAKKSTGLVSWKKYIEDQYAQNISDEFVEPVLLASEDSVVREGDGIIFFNTRPDRGRQLASCFLSCQKKMLHHNSKLIVHQGLSFFMTPSMYDAEFVQLGCEALFQEEEIYDTLLDVLAHQGLKTLIAAESEKYAHVTYFFKGKRENQNKNETLKILPSIKTRSYAACPEMSAQEITNTVLQHLQDYNFILINYANADMVGHTGNFQATVKACEFLDQQIAYLYERIVKEMSGVLVITADHGNAEKMVDEDGNAWTAHTNNKVPFLIVGNDIHLINFQNAGLECIAPTILDLLDIGQPVAMTGVSLIKK